MTEDEMLHYSRLLQRCEAHGNEARAKVRRNRKFFDEEFDFPLSQSVAFLRWRLQAVKAYCRYLTAGKNSGRAREELLAGARTHLEAAIQTLTMYQRLAPKRKEWSDCKPLHKRALKLMNDMLRQWERQRHTKIRSEDAHYPELFTDELQAWLYRPHHATETSFAETTQGKDDEKSPASI